MNERPLYYSNMDLENIVTPVKTDRLVELLRQSGYNEELTLKLEDGFRNGFDLGYEGPMK